jgi:hypothetical protein
MKSAMAIDVIANRRAFSSVVLPCYSAIWLMALLYSTGSRVLSALMMIR